MVLPIVSSAVDAEQFAEVIARLRRASQASTRAGYPWAWPPIAQMELLQALAEQSGVCLDELSGQLHLAPAAAFRMVRDLRVYGLVERTPGLDDRGGEVFRITEAGLRQLACWRDQHRRRIGGALERLPSFRRQALTRALPALAELVEHLAADRRRA